MSIDLVKYHVVVSFGHKQDNRLRFRCHVTFELRPA